MARSIKIPDEEMDILRREAELSSRSLSGQVVHWLRIGRSIEQSPQFTYSHVREALAALRSPDALTPEEQDVFIDDLLGAAADGTPEQQATFAARKRKGLGVGLSPEGETLYEAADATDDAA
ncbi:MAG: hypothetical protein QNI84_04680 [Henriciella sp.]|nr:hypothetical protein [Henriciella sp.]